jgi:hypothetical protein
VITSPTPGSLDEAGYFIERLRSGGMRAQAVVANRWHVDGPPLPDEVGPTIDTLEAGDAEERAVAAMLRDELRREPRQAAESEAMASFARAHVGVPIVPVPELSGDIHDVPGLRRVAAYLTR